MFRNHFKRINGIAEALGHFVTVFVQHETIADNRFERDLVKDHGGNGMEREEPTTGLVHAFCDEIGGEEVTLVKFFLVLKRIVQLSVGHGAGIEPNVNEVSLAAHGSTGGRNEHNLINVGAVQVNAVIVLSAEVSRNKTFLLQRIRFHETALYALFDFCIELFQRGDAHFLFRVGVAPDGQRCSPEA